MKRAIATLVLVWFGLAFAATGQQSAVSQAAVSAGTDSVPHVIRYSGYAKDNHGNPLSGALSVTFSLFKDQLGGTPLWLEVQSLQVDSRGRYTVYLGANTAGGLPQDVFVSGDARWLSVQVEGEAEQPRVLLVSAPYA